MMVILQKKFHRLKQKTANISIDCLLLIANSFPVPEEINS